MPFQTQMIAFVFALLGIATIACADDNAYIVPPSKRPFPVATNRPMADGPVLYVDYSKGKDSNDGSPAKPFKTIAAAAKVAHAGCTIYLRAGVYYEQPHLSITGTKESPITIRAYPNELVILDGGLPEFLDHPEIAWVPCPGGVEGEYWSTNTFEPQGDTRAVEVPGGVNIQGHFADTMVPMQGYWSLGDLRSTNEFWTLAGKGKSATAPAGGEDADAASNIYCGPGILYDPATKHIHCRLAHTTLSGTGNDNYRGETDPRKLRLAISRPGRGSVLTLEDSANVTLQDLVVRGSRGSTIDIVDSSNITLEGCNIYAGQSCLAAQYTDGLRATGCAFRGIAAPWTFRSSLKYRSIEARLISASGWIPAGNANFEFDHCDFTDSVDGIFIANVHNVKLHHSFIDNLSDDCIFLTATTAYDGTTDGGNIHIYQNYISRALTVLSFGVGHGRQKLTPAGRQTGAGVWFYRNVIDERQWIPYFQHRNAEQTEFESIGRMAGDHGSPTWEPLYFYQNTILSGAGAFRDYYLDGMCRAVGENNPRRLFNNVFVQVKGMPGTVFPPANVNLETANNLHWSLSDGSTYTGDFFAKFRGGKIYKESQTLHPPGWTAGDLLADPKLASLSGDPDANIDLRPTRESPLIDAGKSLPDECPDPLRSSDAGKPDIGALPLGFEPWTVGIGKDHTIAGK